MTPLNRLTALFLSVTALSTMVACSSDSNLPKISAKSPYSCSDYNNTFVTGNQHATKVMLQAITDIFNSEYVGDSPIEQFYRNQIKTRFAYGSMFGSSLKEQCLKDSDLGVLDAGQLAVNAVWNDIATKTQFSMCWSLNEGVLKASDLFDKSKAGEKSMFTVSLARETAGKIKYAYKDVLESSDYGQKYIEDKVTSYCLENPAVRAWEAKSLSIQNEAKILADAKQAEVDRLAKERRQRLEQERMAEDLKMYSGSVTGENRPKFSKLEKQLELAQKGNINYEKFLAGLKLSIADVAAEVPDYKRKAIEPLTDELAYEIAELLVNGCQMCDSDYKDRLLHFPKVKEAQSEVVKGLQKLLDKYTEAAAACGSDNTCEAKSQQRAADFALSDAKSCDRYRELGRDVSRMTCFDDSEKFYTYFYSKLPR